MRYQANVVRRVDDWQEGSAVELRCVAGRKTGAPYHQVRLVAHHAYCRNGLFPLLARSRFDLSTSRGLDLLTEVGAQCERAIVVELLVTSPPHGIAHSLYLNLSPKFQALPICNVWKHELGLPNLAG